MKRRQNLIKRRQNEAKARQGDEARQNNDESRQNGDDETETNLYKKGDEARKTERQRSTKRRTSAK